MKSDYQRVVDNHKVDKSMLGYDINKLIVFGRVLKADKSLINTEHANNYKNITTDIVRLIAENKAPVNLDILELLDISLFLAL